MLVDGNVLFAFLVFCALEISHGYFIDDTSERQGNFVQNNFERDLNVDEIGNNVLMKNKIDEAPCQIFTTTYGCCWDNRTIARGPTGAGCPACEDMDTMECRARKDMCTSAEFRRQCPITCQVPCGCKDRFDSWLCSKIRKLGNCQWLGSQCMQTCKKC
ncbi:uncharacterized protein LOC135684025 [Rhopilema esculentum]|uniref:uncharacterized protein LOC135684025 n=1 Tax=Rhopilema esculentum TaxID=499914 RepID=UPI0031D4BE77